MEVKVKLVPSGCDEDGNEQFMELDAAIIDAMKPLLDRHVHRKVDEVTADVIKTVVEERVANLSVEAFSGVFQKTDTWGKPKGEPQSLAEIVEKQAKEYLDAKVNDRGESHYNGRPRVQWMMRQAIKDALQGEIDKQLATLRAEFAAKIAAKIAQVKVE